MRTLTVTVILLFAPMAVAEDKTTRFVPLFNGTTLDGWTERQVKKAQEGRWFVEQGILKAKAGGGWLGTTKQYGDFVLRVEWKIGPNGNSGVFFRVPDKEFSGSPSDAGFEIQILDDTGPKYKDKLKPHQFSGGLYHFIGPSKPVFKGVGEWNTFVLTVKGDAIDLVYNGEPVVSAKIDGNAAMMKRPKKGFIGLQNHDSDVEFRKIEIMEER